ncbi:uncharacterized protein TRIADDRAFT_29402, partial [Trichoplax adhaerens]
VDINLTETETIFLLDIPTTSFSEDTEAADKIKERNTVYTEMLKQRHGDRYTDRFMQTFNDAPKNKEVQTTRFGLTDASVMATNWDMYDTYKEKEGSKLLLLRHFTLQHTTYKSDDDLAEEVPSSQKSNRVSKIAKDEDKSISMTMRDSSMVNDSALRSDAFKQSLFTMERAVTLNNYQHKQAVYRGLSVLPGKNLRYNRLTNPDAVPPSSNRPRIADNDVGKILPNLERLWDYKCSITRGRNISAMTWNKSNPDIIAVGYCQFGYNEQKGGFACCWSIKNPEYPERIFHFNTGVTGLDFSSTSGSLLAVGLYDGTVAIVDVRGTGSQSILDSSESPGKHSGPVWQIKWVDRDRLTGEEHGEMLVSISTDGRITRWSIRKGFECSDLMRLKRISNKKETKDRKLDIKRSHEGLISRFSGGLSFDFYPKDTNIYLTGTEDGHIHKCSCSYNEQYLESYFGHMGPVYKVAWSPYVSDAFLSCSGDWSVKLWNQEKPKAIHSFQSSKEAVNDICWSPTSATTFACVRDRAIEVWDLNVSTLDPIIITHPSGYAKLSSVAFSINSECLLVGDSDGHITIYLLKNIPQPPETHVEILTKLMNPQTITVTEENDENDKK